MQRADQREREERREGRLDGDDRDLGERRAPATRGLVLGAVRRIAPIRVATPSWALSTLPSAPTPAARKTTRRGVLPPALRMQKFQASLRVTSETRCRTAAIAEQPHGRGQHRRRELAAPAGEHDRPAAATRGERDDHRERHPHADARAAREPRRASAGAAARAATLRGYGVARGDDRVVVGWPAGARSPGR